MPSMPSTSPPVSRRRWVLPAVLVLVWLAVGGPLGSFAGRLGEVQTNDNAAFLPAGAESTRVLDLQAQAAGADSFSAIVVWEYDRPATPTQVRAAATSLGEASSVGGLSPDDVTGPLPSEDGLALTAQLTFRGIEADALAAEVEQLRDVLGTQDADAADAGGAPAVYVTGMAGVLADFFVAFEGIDGVLLGVALLVVLVILLLVYRSPVLPLVVLLSALLALGVASAVVYALARADVLQLNGQSQGIMFILVVGAATDYALLLVSRFREELRETPHRSDAMRQAYRGAVEPIVASAGTVVLGLLCLLLSDLASIRGLGPVGAIGVVAALAGSLTFLPAVLVLLGRVAFWPFRPVLGSPHPEQRGIWGRIARGVGAHPRRTWALTAIALLAASAFVPQFRDEGVTQTDTFLDPVESVQGQEALARHFPGGSGDPAIVVATPEQLSAVRAVLGQDPGVARVPDAAQEGTGASQPPRAGDQVLVPVVLTDQVDSQAAEDTVRRLRSELDIVGADVLVGGSTAIALDTLETSTRDRNVVIPAILVVIFVVLALLLRSLVAPLVLIVANLVSFGATLGVSALVFNHVFDFPGADPSVTLIAFVFLVALGIDYSIFLMTRVREESMRQRTRPGILRGLSVTGGVITSAGVVLAATFAALSVLPLLFLAQIAFLVAFGVLLDTIVVRSLLVPALCYDLGRWTWWPSPLTGAEGPARHRA